MRKQHKKIQARLGLWAMCDYVKDTFLNPDGTFIDIRPLAREGNFEAELLLPKHTVHVYVEQIQTGARGGRCHAHEHGKKSYWCSLYERGARLACSGADRGPTPADAMRKALLASGYKLRPTP